MSQKLEPFFGHRLIVSCVVVPFLVFSFSFLIFVIWCLARAWNQVFKSYTSYVIDNSIYSKCWFTCCWDSGTYLWLLLLQPSFSLQAYSGHTSHVVSLDFHPKKNDLFCSCDDNNEIRFWNISQYSCTRVFKVVYEIYLI